MSISKSLAGMVAGRLIDREVFDPDAEVAAYIPELKHTAYGDATAQQVLDMAVAVRFNQEYDNPQSDVQTEDRASGWRPRLSGDPPDTKAFLATIQGEGEHGTRLQYCSATTDVLAWLMERASGRPYAELLGEELWSQIGAEHDAYVTVDDSGFPYACAGVCATLRDVARFGRLVLDGGVWSGRTVLPKSWIDATRHGAGSPVTSALDFEAVWGAYPDAVYHNQWWTTRGPHGAFFGAGIFGQYLWLDPQSDVVIVKLSSLPAPNPPEDNKEHMTALDALASAVAE